MALTKKQVGVLKGMLTGAAVILATIIFGVWNNPFGFAENLGGYERLVIAIKSAVLPAICLAVSVGRLAKHRFFTPDDIDGGGLSKGTEQAIILQSLLQNTLEQFSIAVIAYLSWAVVMPVTWLSVVPLAAIVFVIGRIMFFTGYKYGAPSRAIGFTLSFYMSLAMLICVMVAVLWHSVY